MSCRSRCVCVLGSINLKSNFNAGNLRSQQSHNILRSNIPSIRVVRIKQRGRASNSLFVVKLRCDCKMDNTFCEIAKMIKYRMCNRNKLMFPGVFQRLLLSLTLAQSLDTVILIVFSRDLPVAAQTYPLSCIRMNEYAHVECGRWTCSLRIVEWETFRARWPGRRRMYVQLVLFLCRNDICCCYWICAAHGRCNGKSSD